MSLELALSCIGRHEDERSIASTQNPWPATLDHLVDEGEDILLTADVDCRECVSQPPHHPSFRCLHGLYHET